MIETIKKNLKEVIEDSGLSKTEIGRRIGVTQGAISQYTMRIALPALDTLAKLCKVLDVSADYILGITDYYGKKNT